MRWSGLLFILTLSLLTPLWGQERQPIQLASRGAGAAQRRAYYRAMVSEYAGGQCDNGLWVLALRGAAADGTRRASSLNTGGYQDTLIVLDPNKEDAEEFRAATHGGAARSPDFPFGVAQLKPGRYSADPVKDQSGPMWSLTVEGRADKLPAWLDRDGDGWLSDEEKTTDDYYATTTKSVFVCRGLDSEEPNRVGAQTLPPDEYDRFVASVGKGRSFQYLLLDANDPVKIESSDLKSLSAPLANVDNFSYYEKLALKKGVQPGFELLVVLLRGIAPSGDRHDSADNVGPYNDTFLVLDRAELAVTAFRGSSHAGQASTTRSPGVYAGVAQLRPGLYWARSNNIYHGVWSWHIVNDEGDYAGRVPAWRDRDKDGYISPQERAAAERAGVTASEILIHNGLSYEVGNSIGCLTMPPDTIVRFIQKVGKGYSFPILLLDANQDP